MHRRFFMSKHLTGLALGLVLTTTAAWGGVVYVPIGANVTDDQGNTLRTDVRLSNDGNKQLDVSYVFIPAGVDGSSVDRSLLSETMSIGARNSVRVRDFFDPDQIGILEIVADPEIAITSRLVTSFADGGESLGTEMTVITAANAVPGGKTAFLQGLRRDDVSIETDLFILNVSDSRNDCAVEIYKFGGLKIVSETISVPPISLTPFKDVFGLIGESSLGEARAAITCTDPAQPFALIRNLDPAETVFVQPSGTGSSGFSGGGGGGNGTCPADALFNEPGVFHVPVKGGEVLELKAPMESGSKFSKIVLDMSFVHGGWNKNSNFLHSIFWLNRASTWASNLFGYLNAFGPNKNTVKMQTNVDLTPGDLIVAESNAKLNPGTEYSVHYEYDAANRKVTAQVSEKGGPVVVTRQTATSVNVVRSVAPGWFIVFGHKSNGSGSKEVETYGWQYKDLCVQLIP